MGQGTDSSILSYVLVSVPQSDLSVTIVVSIYGVSTYEGRKEMFYLTMRSTHFIYGYMASDIW